MLYILHKNRLLLVILSMIMLLFKETAGKDTVNTTYRERVQLQVGRNLFITGETIWYKAFTFSNLRDIYSKVLYVELVDIESRHVLGQIVEISEGVAASSLTIPDTLTTGMYTLKAYTNWMRNFNPVLFASFPVYIFNQYDDTEGKNELDYSLILKPNIYLENGKLIHQASTQVKIEFPGWMSDTVRGFLIENTTGRKKAGYLINKNGLGFFTFTPLSGERYRIEIQPTFGQKISFELPLVESVSPAINVLEGIGDELNLQPINLPVKTATYQLVVNKGDKLIWEESISGTGNDTIKLNLGSERNGLVNIELLDRASHPIANKQVYMNRNTEKFQFYDQTIRTRAPVEIPIESLIEQELDLSSLSVSIYKSAFPELQENAFISTTSFEHDYSMDETGKDYQVLLSLYHELNDNKILLQQNEEGNLKFPVEDIGVLYSGRVVNSVNGGPLAGVDVILSVKDTIPLLLFSNTDRQGRFFYLINDYGEKYALINLYLLGARLSGSFNILLDNKFYYQKNVQLISEIVLEKEDKVVDYLDDEAQRVLIQRAYGREDTKIDSTIIFRDLKKPFYSDKVSVVYPSEYFDLPNFEEIAREILPKVRYKQTKTGCNVSIFDVDYGIKTSSPIVLLDGLPVKEYCDLYPLKSEDINRVEIVSGANITGNLFYEGVLAVYASSLYRIEKANKNGRSFYNVSGYHIPPEFKISDYNTTEKNSNKLADFKNQLYWDPEIKTNESSDIIRFYTSDEEATYTIDICGYSYNGQLVRVKRMFNVKSE